jgi:lipid-A-disaccharide synthase
MLVNSLSKLNASFQFYGVGGDSLYAENVTLIYNYELFASMGIIEPILKLRFYKNALETIQDYIFSNEIDTAILIDFPGFNLRLAEKLKKQNIKIIYYISPQIWAWHYLRIKKIKKFVDAMIVIYPFEEEIYKKEGVRAFFTGNPLVDILSSKLSAEKDITFEPARPCIGLLPGSRLSEVKRHLPALLESAILLKEKYNSSFIIPVINEDIARLVRKTINNLSKKLDLRIVFNNTYKAIEKCDFIVLSSGTATLETALIGKPMVIIYKVDLISELIGRLVVKVKNIGLVNIVAGRRICPELLQRNVTGKNIFSEVSNYLDNEKLKEKMLNEIAEVKNIIGDKGATNRIAKLVFSLIHE